MQSMLVNSGVSTMVAQCGPSDGHELANGVGKQYTSWDGTTSDSACNFAFVASGIVWKGRPPDIHM